MSPVMPCLQCYEPTPSEVHGGLCHYCFTVPQFAWPNKQVNNMTRQYETGATRDSAENKLDYEGFLSPLVLKRFAEYMHECRLRNIPEGQEIRSSDNWQKGMPVEDYVKSLLRHTMSVWLHHDNFWPETNEDYQTALCAILFNVQGLLHEELLRVKKLHRGFNAPAQT